MKAGFPRLLFAIMWIAFSYTFLWHATMMLPGFLGVFGPAMYFFFLPFFIISYAFLEVGYAIYPIGRISDIIEDLRDIKIKSMKEVFFLLFFLIWMSFIFSFIGISSRVAQSFGPVIWTDPNPIVTSIYLFLISVGFSLLVFFIKRYIARKF